MHTGETASPDDEVTLVFSTFEVIETMVRGFVEIVRVQVPYLNDHDLLRFSVTDVIVGNKQSEGKALHISTGVTDSRRGHILPNHFQPRIKEILILLAPPITHLSPS